MRYLFVGSGAGVPGIPHRVTQADIDAMTAEQLAEFREAVSGGIYVPEVTDKSKQNPKIMETVVSDEGAKL